MSFDILDRLAEVNPYPEGTNTPDSILSAAATRAVIDDRRRDMQTQAKKTTELDATQKRTRRGLLVAAAAFIAVILIGVSIAIFSGGSETTPTVSPATTTSPSTTEDAPTTTEAEPTTQPPTTTWSIGDQERAMAIAMDGLALLNSSDSEAWAKWREAFQGEPDERQTASLHAALHAAGARFVIDKCEPRGPQTPEWAPPGFVVVCETTRSDAYGDAFEWNVREVFTVVVGTTDQPYVGSDYLHNTDGMWNIFLRGFRDWLEATHPGVHAQITYASYEDGILPDATSAELALQYLDEYAATLEQ